jgi:hypothetical protein
MGYGPIGLVEGFGKFAVKLPANYGEMTWINDE